MTQASPAKASLSFGLVAFLVLTMVAATLLHGSLSVISSDVIEEFDLTRSQFGVAIALVALVGALASPLAGRLADRSLRRSTIGLFVFVAAGTATAAFGPVFFALLLGSVLAGLGGSAGNPVTNRIISMRTTASQIGIAVGLKQTGPQLGLLAAGLTLPLLASWFGWRIALMATVVLPLIGLVLAPRFMTAVSRLPAATESAIQETNHGPHSWLAVASGTFALGLGTVIAFAPLYAREKLGMSAAAAGLLAAVMGIVGVAGRALWAAFADRFWSATTTLLVLAVASALATLLLWAATAAVWLAWVGALLAGASMFSWLAVAWVVLLSRAAHQTVGRVSGTQGLAVGLGFAAGPPVVGALIDAVSYGAAWGLVTALFLAAAALLIAVR